MITDLHARAMAHIAGLVQQRLDEHPLIERLYAGGGRVTFGYTDTHVWLEQDGRRMQLYLWPHWWESGLGTQEDRAGDIAALLAGEPIRFSR